VVLVAQRVCWKVYKRRDKNISNELGFLFSNIMHVIVINHLLTYFKEKDEDTYLHPNHTFTQEYLPS
jgi:hypothetical protein